MMEMKVGIAFGFLFNNTGYEWHELQREACDFMSKQVLHCMVGNFKGEPDVTYHPEGEEGSRSVDMYFRFNGEKSRIDIVALLTPEDIKE